MSGSYIVKTKGLKRTNSSGDVGTNHGDYENDNIKADEVTLEENAYDVDKSILNNLV